MSSVRNPALTAAREPGLGGGGRWLRRQCACGGQSSTRGQCEACARRAATSHRAGIAPPIVHDVLSRSGQALDAPTRSFLEPRFGHDFSGVRLHAGSQADEAARAVDARAFTVGQSIVLGRDSAGAPPAARLNLLAHELSHTLQQPPMHGSDEPIRIGAADAPAEREADASAARALGAGTAEPSPVSLINMPLLQRQTTTDAPPWIPLPHPLDRLNIAPQFPGSPVPVPDQHALEQANAYVRGKKPDGSADCRGMLGFAPGSGAFKGQCCSGSYQSATTCCPPDRFSFRDNRCCKADEVLQGNACVQTLDKGAQPVPDTRDPLLPMPPPPKPPLQDLPGSTLPPGQAYA